MKKITRKKLVNTMVALGFVMGISAPAFANSLPTSGGLYIANGLGGGSFYSFTYIASNLQVVQSALNNAGGMTNVYLDIEGQATNFGQFISANASTGISNATFTSYAQSHAYTIPSGTTVYSVSQGQYTYNAGIATIPTSAPTNVSVTANQTSATVSFGSVTDATGYIVMVSNSSGNIVSTQMGTTSPISVSGLSAGTTYIVTVEATNAQGTGPASTMQMFTTASPSPEISTVQAQNGQMILTFSQPLSTIPSLSDFTILQSINGQGDIPIQANVMSINTAKTQLTLTIPTVPVTTLSQNVVDMVQFQGYLPLTTSFIVSAVAPAKITVSTPNSLVSGSGNSVTVTATVYDANGQGIPGETVNWTSSNPNVATITASAMTNASGVATATITVGSIVGTSQIIANAGGIAASPVLFTTS